MKERKKQSCNNCRFQINSKCVFNPVHVDLPQENVPWCGRWQYAVDDLHTMFEYLRPVPDCNRPVEETPPES